MLCADEGGFVGRALAVTTVRRQAWELEREEAMALGKTGSGITTVGVVVIALLFAGFAWFPLVLPGVPEVEIAPVAADAPAFGPLPSYSWVDLSLALPRLGVPTVSATSAPPVQAVPVRVPLTPGVAAGVDPD